MINAEMLVRLNTTEEQVIDLLDRDVREIFSTMVGADVQKLQTTITETAFNDYVTAIVGFVGSYSGMISINTPKKLAMAFTSQMLGMDVTECNVDVHDALGEIANMIGGSFKHHFIADGHEVQLSIPSVILGGQYVTNTIFLPDTITLMFECAAENFLVSVYLDTEEKNYVRHLN